MDAQGWPDARVLSLKNVDARGWHFSVKSASPKARQVEQQDRVALTFYWPALGRQIPMRGQALQLSEEECAHNFLARPLASRAAAMAVLKSEVLEQPETASTLAEAFTLLQAQPDDVDVGWRVYAVNPAVVESWQRASDRNHIRWR